MIYDLYTHMHNIIYMHHICFICNVAEGSERSTESERFETFLVPFREWFRAVFEAVLRGDEVL